MKYFMLCLAVANSLSVEKLPSQFQTIRRLKRVFVSRKVLFKKVTIISNGQSSKLKGSICNITVSEVDRNCVSLPRSAESNGLIIVKLERKAEYRSHVVFEPVRQSFVDSF